MAKFERKIYACLGINGRKEAKIFQLGEMKFEEYKKKLNSQKYLNMALSSSDISINGERKNETVNLSGDFYSCNFDEKFFQSKKEIGIPMIDFVVTRGEMMKTKMIHATLYFKPENEQKFTLSVNAAPGTFYGIVRKVNNDDETTETKKIEGPLLYPTENNKIFEYLATHETVRKMVREQYLDYIKESRKMLPIFTIPTHVSVIQND